ncbi:MAG: ATP-binding protein [Myxococcota bacterium]
MEIRLQTSLIAALVSVALAVSVLLRTRRGPEQRLFGLLALNLGAWYLTRFLELALSDGAGSGFFGRLHLVFGVLFPLSIVRFFRAFVAEEATRRIRRLNRVASGLAVVLLVLAATPLHEHLAFRTALLAYVFLALGGALVAVVRWGRQVESSQESRRLLFLAAMGGLAALFALPEYLPAVGLELPPLGTVLVLLFLYLLHQSVLGSRLIDLYELAGRLAVLTALSFTLAGLLWLLVRFTGETSFLQPVVASLVVLLLFDPLRSRVSAQIQRLLFRDRVLFERTITNLRRRVAHVLEVDDLAAVLMEGFAESRRFARAALYLATENRRALDLAGALGSTPLTHIEVAPARPLLERLERKGHVTLEGTLRRLEAHRLRGEDRAAETLLEVAQGLKAMGTSVALALRRVEGELYGLLCVGDATRDAFSDDEVGLLRGLVTQAAIALENSRLFQRLNERDRLAALGEMAAGLAHEVRNPLGAIKAAAQYVEASQGTPGEAGEPEREMLEVIVEEVDRLGRVVGGFLDYAKPGRGDPSPVDAGEVARRTVQLMEAQARAQGTRLLLAHGEALPPVRIDAEQLKQVLLNLLRNALQALEDRGDGEITVEVAGVPPAAPKHVELRVHDDGPGISAAIRSKLFVPFVTTKDDGTGLGLALSQRIVSAAGGSIEARSPRGQGATFVVRLPAASRESSPGTTRAAYGAMASSAAAASKGSARGDTVPGAAEVPSG